MPKNEKLIKSLRKLLDSTTSIVREEDVSQYFQEDNPGLRAYFSHVLEGQKEDYRTPFARTNTGKDTPVEEIIEDWSHVLDAIKDKYPSLYEFENDLKAKVGPMSIMKPLEERLDDIVSYYTGISSPGDPIEDCAYAEFSREFGRLFGVRQRSFGATWLDMKKSTNSGNPFFSKRSKVHDLTVPFMLAFGSATKGGAPSACIQYLQNGGKWLTCANLGWRGQEGGPSDSDVKQRVVWMFPLAINIAELTVYQPCIAGVQRLNLIPAYVGMEDVDAKVTQLFDTKAHDDLVVCTDFTKFD